MSHKNFESFLKESLQIKGVQSKTVQKFSVVMNELNSALKEYPDNGSEILEDVLKKSGIVEPLSNFIERGLGANSPKFAERLVAVMTACERIKGFDAEAALISAIAKVEKAIAEIQESNQQDDDRTSRIDSFRR